MLGRIINNRALIYLFGELFSKLSPFIALPLLTRVLSPEEYAIYSLFSVTVFFGYILSSLATTSYIPIVFFKNKDELKSCVITIISLSNTVFVVSIIILFPVFSFLNISTVYIYCTFGALIVGYLSVGFQVVLSLLQCEQKAFKYISLNIIRSTLFLILVFFAFYKDLSESKYYIMLYGLSYLLLLPYIIINLVKRFGLCIFKYSISKKVLYFGLPSIPNALANWCKTSIDRYFILLSLGVVNLGYYSVAYQLAFGTVVMSSALVKAMSPRLYQLLNNNGFDTVARRHCFKYFLIFSSVSLIYSGFLFLFSNYIVGGSYGGIEYYSCLLVFSALFQGGASFFVGVIFFNEKIKYALMCNFFAIAAHFVFLCIVLFFNLSLFYFILVSFLSSFIYFIIIYRGANGYYIEGC